MQRTWRGTIIHSRVGTNVSLRLTTRKPSEAIVATLRWRFTSLMFVNFLEGRVA